jgi:hypothetical protein
MIDVAEYRSARSPRRNHHHTSGGTSSKRSNRIGLAKDGNGFSRRASGRFDNPLLYRREVAKIVPQTT